MRLVGAKGVRFAVEHSGIANPHLEIRVALIHLGVVIARENQARAAERQRVVVIRVDELQNADNEQRSQLLSALGDVLEATVALQVPGGATLEAYLPVLLYVTGLPDLLNRGGRRRRLPPPVRDHRAGDAHRRRGDRGAGDHAAA